MINVIIPISDEQILALCQLNKLYTNKEVTIDHERLRASDGMEIPLSSIIQAQTSEEKNNYTQFIMGVTASVITYLELIK